jgi:hypothetical protein
MTEPKAKEGSSLESNGTDEAFHEELLGRDRLPPDVLERLRARARELGGERAERLVVR